MVKLKKCLKHLDSHLISKVILYLVCSSWSLPGAIWVPGKYFSGKLNIETLSGRCQNRTRFFESLLQFIRLSTNNSWSSNSRSTYVKHDVLLNFVCSVPILPHQLRTYNIYPFETLVNVPPTPNEAPFEHDSCRPTIVWRAHKSFVHRPIMIWMHHLW